MIKNKKVVALIPAKSQSVRVPGKNLRELGGEPLLVRKIHQLQESNYIDCIYVGSDSDHVLTLAESAGAIPIRRDVAACDEKISTANKMIEDFAKRVTGEIALWAHCTNPFLYAQHYDKALALFAESIGQFDSVISVNRLQSHMWNKFGHPMNYDPYAERHALAKELDHVYFQDGGIFIQNLIEMQKNSYFFGKRPSLIEFDFFESYDINTEEEFSYAHVLLEAMDKKFKYKRLKH